MEIEFNSSVPPTAYKNETSPSIFGGQNIQTQNLSNQIEEFSSSDDEIDQLKMIVEKNLHISCSGEGNNLPTTLSQEERLKMWNETIQNDFEFDLSQYDQQSLDHMKKTFKTPCLSDFVDKIEQSDDILRVSTIPQFNIPKCNTLYLDMHFLSTWIAHPLSNTSPAITFFTPGQNSYIPIPNNETIDSNKEEEFPSNEITSLQTIDKSWCKHVLIQYEERDLDGNLKDKYRVIKEPRRIKLQGKISEQWLECLRMMRVGESRWFQISPLSENGQPLSFEGSQVDQNAMPYFLMIHIIQAVPLATPSFNVKQSGHVNLLESPPSYDEILTKCDSINQEGKQIFGEKDYESAEKIFKKAFCFWKGITRKEKKSFTNAQVDEYANRLNSYGGNYVQCLLNQKKYQECFDIFVFNKSMSSEKNQFRLAKCCFGLGNYEKALAIAQNLIQNNNSQNKEVFQLQTNCLYELKKQEKNQINQFYSNIFA